MWPPPVAAVKSRIFIALLSFFSGGERVLSRKEPPVFLALAPAVCQPQALLRSQGFCPENSVWSAAASLCGYCTMEAGKMPAISAKWATTSALLFPRGKV